jgi:hypothetical protein
MAEKTPEQRAASEKQRQSAFATTMAEKTPEQRAETIKKRQITRAAKAAKQHKSTIREKLLPV